MGTAYSFNAFAFDNVIAQGSGYVCQGFAIQANRRVNSLSPPRSDISKQQDSGEGPAAIVVHTTVVGTSQSDFRTRLHNLRKNTWGGVGQAKLYLESDKYWNARCKAFNCAYDPSGIATRTIVQLDFEAADPFLYYDSVPAASVLSVSTPSVTVNNTGEAYADPTFTLTGPLSSLLTVTRTSPTPTQNFTYAVNIAAGHTLVVDVPSRTVKLDGTESWLSFGGDGTTAGFIRLEPGNNTITLSTGNAGDTGTVSVSFIPRDPCVDG